VQDARNAVHSYDSDVFFNRSLDGGLTWLQSDVRLNTNAPGAGWSWSPEIAAVGPSVAVAWLDHRNAGLAQGSDVYSNRSLDSGTTWLSSDVRLNTSSPGVAPIEEPQIAASGSSVYVAWEDHRNGTSYWDVDIYFNIPFGHQLYGPATPGSNGLAPALSGDGFATIGGTSSIDVTNGLGGAAGVTFIGVGPTSKASIPLLSGIVLVRPTLAVPLTLGGAVGVPGAGTGFLLISIPADPSLVGTNLNFQGVFLDAGAPRGVSMTNGVQTWIG